MSLVPSEQVVKALKEARLCLACQQPIPTNRRGPTRYCSNECSRRSYRQRVNEWNRAKREAQHPDAPPLGELATCALARCGNTFIRTQRTQKFCSSRCFYNYRSNDPVGRGETEGCRVFFRECGACGEIKTWRSKTNAYRICDDCKPRRKLEYQAVKSAGRVNDGRRPLTVFDLAERDGAICHLCQEPVDMTIPGRDRFGPTVDHIVPVKLGGTNDPSNLALAHKFCNASRGVKPVGEWQAARNQCA